LSGLLLDLDTEAAARGAGVHDHDDGGMRVVGDESNDRR